MGAVREALEALGHPAGALPEPRLLADLFLRFQAQVPLRAAPGGGVEEHLAAWLEEGAGLCGAERTAAFASLAAGAGFALAPARARDASGALRGVLLAAGGRVLLDPAFPLAAPLSLDPPAEGEPTGYGGLSVRREAGALSVYLETRGEERPLFAVETGIVSAGGEASTHGGAPDGLFRLLDDRLLRWSGGVLEVSDAWSRLRIPFPATDRDGLEALFGPPISAGPLPGASPIAEAGLAVYLAAAQRPDQLKALLADPVTHAGLLPEGWGVEKLALRDGGFERELVEDGRLLRRERVTHLSDGCTLEAEGPLAHFRTRTFRLEPRPTGTRLRLLATFRDPVPPRGLPEGTRRRLVFELASELLALDRLVSER